MDLESQEHILNYQLPVAISRYNVGLVVIDSITSNYRAEHSSSGIQALSMRSGELAKLGQLLRNLAVNENLAVVVANQVSDRFDQGEGYPISRIGGGNSGIITGSQSPMPKSRPEAAAGNAELLSQPNLMLPASSPAFPSSPYVEEEQQQQQQFDGSYLVGNPVRNEILSLVHQQRFFTGWGDTPPQQSITPTPVYSSSFHRSTDKTPALGFVWATQIGCRIALKKELPPEDIADLTIPVLEQNTSTPTNPQPPTGPTEDKTKPEPSTQQPPTNQTGESEKPASNPPTLQTTPPEPVERSIRRTMKLVFAPWSAGSTLADGNGKEEVRGIRDEVGFKIWKGGLQSISYD
ncbi:hypothetical protein ASPWEDRAFT_501621 [Aspergillus wentii DTO 134E9]|uniref:RecA family profile 1 domain-containing protein n=1 Tax=Aspergillus wentii DTO 134E9 TaxID=1073089 RepID=A0A1L9RJY1_ASPWE|nr:uncharacterized protein ASPWEDRAFT_501621 [Aspergillus wentii DTO 134E9]OJJ35242.1 hypothetical protein ASPWEDRAFT_501621 [Aspergillus wentii DTO 134E9]